MRILSVFFAAVLAASALASADEYYTPPAFVAAATPLLSAKGVPIPTDDLERYRQFQTIHLLEEEPEVPESLTSIGTAAPSLTSLANSQFYSLRILQTLQKLQQEWQSDDGRPANEIQRDKQYLLEAFVFHLTNIKFTKPGLYKDFEIKSKTLMAAGIGAFLLYHRNSIQAGQTPGDVVAFVSTFIASFVVPLTLITAYKVVEARLEKIQLAEKVLREFLIEAGKTQLDVKLLEQDLVATARNIQNTLGFERAYFFDNRSSICARLLGRASTKTSP